MTENTSNQRTQSNRKNVKVYTPAQMKEYMDRFVVGQDEAKKTLAVAVYNHYKRIARKHAGVESGVEHGKSNVLLLGETGSGKTLLVRTIARMLDVPCHIQDCTKITASGYVGSDVEDCIVGLLRASNYDIPASQCGIVMLDEVDKLRAMNAGPSVVRDVSGECVQQSLLKIMEGDTVGCPPMGGRKHPEQPLLYVDTSDILFIASGAFVGLDDIVSRRLNLGRNRVGFETAHSATALSEGKSVLSKVQPCDLRSFGLIPEFIGRLPVIANVEPLTRNDLVRILTEPCDSLTRQYKDLLAWDGVKLEFTQDALETVADFAVKMGTGARGLRNILETVMRDIMFDAPSMRKPRNGEKSVCVTADLVRKKVSDYMQS